MTTAYDPYGAPGQRREPLDPLLSLPDHPSGEWATSRRHTPRVGHPRPARAADPYLVSPASSTAYPLVAEPATEPAVLNGRGRTRLVTLAIVVVLVLVSGWQAYRLERVGRNNDELGAVLSAERDKSSQLTDRTTRLEKQLAGVFDPEAISSAVLPSVFRVRAGQFTGTAFSIGGKAPSGEANLLTNFHVVESVWNAGNRRVYLERGKDELSASIVKVSRDKDLALLRATKKITGLAAAPTTVKPGQQIVVVGAPLGLEDSVTTGVVSAYRQEDNGPTIQFDAPINPGNSGGPVVNSADEVVGLATAKARDAEGIGLAIPIKTACDAFGVC
ncbi:MAG TPA: trypsin-like peptidase domain-containing protein [Actinoplanes sp.]|jgi:putative serine protease PepD|nr:trypsin-like peptidase domain-containing protein [Actinoplanes sp.]